MDTGGTHQGGADNHESGKTRQRQEVKQPRTQLQNKTGNESLRSTTVTKKGFEAKISFNLLMLQLILAEGIEAGAKKAHIKASKGPFTFNLFCPALPKPTEPKSCLTKIGGLVPNQSESWFH